MPRTSPPLANLCLMFHCTVSGIVRVFVADPSLAVTVTE
ncbi:hypothetical protein ACP_3051 [Acidobacterium capsulatum ATCC 51196]|uniref:Uncharacterized protein n=1 Tax=Acidobacterium capsulatum (strain ATCC 51196 / DSM 11244 / BCRC 80197 / JCM 7670 / NBRC 15755 / NCIMB 13165 / 161) TaxID=240015 RepID=C1F4K8_ACIC5|nr:hypothetical protein ACP_3051 [Acidobacterium capsulatum ATCC 51196]